jgi:hypothetical protein
MTDGSRLRGNVQRDNRGVEGGNHLSVSAPPVVVPVRHRDDSLPFENPAGDIDRQPKLATSALDGAERAKAARKARPDMHWNIEPSGSECSLAPSPLIGNEPSASNKYGDSGIDTFWLPAHIPGWDDSRSDRYRWLYREEFFERVRIKGPFRHIDKRSAVEGHPFLPCNTGNIIAPQLLLTSANRRAVQAADPACRPRMTHPTSSDGPVNPAERPARDTQPVEIE